MTSTVSAQHKMVKAAIKEVATTTKKSAALSAGAQAATHKPNIRAAVSRAAVAAAASTAATGAVAVPSGKLQLYYRAVPTPLGPFSLYVDGDGAIRCCHWQVCAAEATNALAAEQREVCASLQSRWYKNCTIEMATLPPSASLPGEAAAALLEQYFNPTSADAGRPEVLERLLLQVPVVYPPTTNFMKTTWDVLRQTVPSGQTISYKGLGVRVSQALPKASHASPSAAAAAPRAIGMAMGANPIPVVVPCHRVLSTTNSLRGYGLGLRFKVWLLRHEQAAVPSEKLSILENENAVSTVISRR